MRDRITEFSQRQGIQFSSFNTVSSSNDLRYCLLILFHAPFGLSFHYFSSLLLVMHAPPSQSARSVVLAVSSCREGGFGPNAPQLDQNESAKQISEATRKQPNICHPSNCCVFIVGIVRFRFNEAVRHLCRNINKSKVCC